jgi:hypothetical protein
MKQMPIVHRAKSFAERLSIVVNPKKNRPVLRPFMGIRPVEADRMPGLTDF